MNLLNLEGGPRRTGSGDGGKTSSVSKRELAWVRRGAQARSTKQKARLQRYETLKAQDVARRADTLDPIALKSRLGKTIFDIEHLTFSRGDIPIVKDFTYHVVRHDRIGIVGPNGIGKSTFMGLLDGKFEPDAGTLGRGETVRIAHFTQELPVFDEDQRVLDYIREDHRLHGVGRWQYVECRSDFGAFPIYPGTSWCTDSQTIGR